jgi:hypothetical protein
MFHVVQVWTSYGLSGGLEPKIQLKEGILICLLLSDNTFSLDHSIQ